MYYGEPVLVPTCPKDVPGTRRYSKNIERNSRTFSPAICSSRFAQENACDSSRAPKVAASFSVFLGSLNRHTQHASTLTRNAEVASHEA
jgi:hypothetical protein